MGSNYYIREILVDKYCAKCGASLNDYGCYSDNGIVTDPKPGIDTEKIYVICDVYHAPNCFKCNPDPLGYFNERTCRQL